MTLTRRGGAHRQADTGFDNAFGQLFDSGLIERTVGSEWRDHATEHLQRTTRHVGDHLVRELLRVLIGE
jgi:hypothetical protein